jgi:antitoxin CptB
MPTSETPDIRLKRLIYRSWHRGFKEMDLILGNFANERLRALSDSQIDAYERLIDEPDNEIYSWLLEKAETPDQHRTDVFEMIKSFETLPNRQ